MQHRHLGMCFDCASVYYDSQDYGCINHHNKDLYGERNDFHCHAERYNDNGNVNDVSRCDKYGHCHAIA